MSALGHHKEIIELRYKCYSLEKIGELFGVSHQRIGQILKKYGVVVSIRNKAKPKKTPEEWFKVRSQRFWASVDMTNKNGCWEWKKFRDPIGYGRCKIPELKSNAGGYAHRTAWVLTNGSIPAGLCVCHSCDNPACCNPAHLWLGTMTENIKDRDEKHRGGRYGSRISKSIIQNVLMDYSNGITQAKIALTYGIGSSTVRCIVHRRGCYENL
jgi:hypothetical protein